MDNVRVRVLMIDDDQDEYVLIFDLLSEACRGEFHLDWVATYDWGLDAIRRNEHDVYLIDYRLGGRTGLELIRDAHESGCGAPLILLTGQGDREVDIEAMNSGASDYLVKGQIDATSLERSIRYAIEHKRGALEREGLVRELQARLAQIKTLSGLLPICASCKSVRDDSGFWSQMETYLTGHSDAEFTHSICPQCVDRLYPEVALSESGAMDTVSKSSE